ncbi:roadblock/LC7 domain-containing protein [Flavobacterium jumunjinense]
MNYNMLQKLIEETAIESALIFDKNGKLIDSCNIEKPQTISAMSNTILEMCQGLVEELNEKKINQIIIKGNSLLLIGSTINKNQYLISICNDISKLGLLLKVIDNLEK